MPTKRTSRKRNVQLKPVAQRLLDGDPIERTAEVRAELVQLKFFGWRDHLPDQELGLRLERLAAAELERWDSGDP